MENKNNQVLDDVDIKIETSFKSTVASQIGKWCAISSFVIGTVLLFLGLYDLDSYFLWGFNFVFFAILINILVMIILLLAGKTPAENQVNEKMTLKMLINIPIAIVYFIIFICVSLPLS